MFSKILTALGTLFTGVASVLPFIHGAPAWVAPVVGVAGATALKLSAGSDAVSKPKA